MTSGVKGFFLLGLLISVMSCGATAQTMPPPPSGSEQSTNVPYFTLRDGMDSVLTLNNLAPYPTITKVTIFNMHGDARPLDALTLAPRSITQIDLAQSVDRGRFDSGNVEISYTGKMMQVTAQVSIFSVDKRVDIESREQDITDFESTNMAGILSLPDGGEGYLAITDVSSQALTAKLLAGDHEKQIRLQPRETRLIRLNDELEGHAPYAKLIRLQDQGLPGDIIATGFVLNLKTGYSSAFMMTDPAVATSNVLAGVHFWAGAPAEKAGFPRGTYFHSPLMLANLSNSPVTAHIFVNDTPQPGDPSAAEGHAVGQVSTTRTQKLASQHVNARDLTIPPGGVETYDLAETVGQLVSSDSDANGFEVTYDAPPGSLIGHLTSASASGDYSFEVPVRDPSGKDMTSGGGGYPWTVENGTNTTLHLMNTTDKAAWAIVEFRFPDGTTYDPDRITLQPHQAFAIDIQKLKASKQTDIHDKLFPANQDDGQLIWVQGTLHALIGRAEQVNVGDGFSRSFSCLYCTCPDNVSSTSVTLIAPTSNITNNVGYFNPDYTNTGTNDNQADYLSSAQYVDCFNNSTGSYYVSSGWWSSDTDVADISTTPDYTGVFIATNNAGSTSIVADSQSENYYDDQVGGCTDEGSQSWEASAAAKVCDFSIRPAAVTAGDYGNGVENMHQVIQAVPSDSSCQVVPSQSKCQVGSSGNVTIDYNNSYDDINSYVANCVVSYFAGPPGPVPPNSPDSIDVTITIKFAYTPGNAVVHSQNVAIN